MEIRHYLMKNAQICKKTKQKQKQTKKKHLDKQTPRFELICQLHHFT